MSSPQPLWRSDCPMQLQFRPVFCATTLPTANGQQHGSPQMQRQHVRESAGVAQPGYSMRCSRRQCSASAPARARHLPEGLSWHRHLGHCQQAASCSAMSRDSSFCAAWQRRPTDQPRGLRGTHWQRARSRIPAGGGALVWPAEQLHERPATRASLIHPNLRRAAPSLTVSGDQVRPASALTGGEPARGLCMTIGISACQAPVQSRVSVFAERARL